MKIYCSGIGGIGLSAYAALQKANGHEVLGSDRAESDILKKLRGQGIKVALNQDGTFIPEDSGLFVYSEAIPKDAPERLRTGELNIRSISYFQALGELAREFKFVIAVCGTHGKSTTTAMAAKVLMDAGMNPTVIVGTKVPEFDGRNWRKGGNEYLLVEACEYRKNFLHIHPEIILMTNADGDHFDAFLNIKEYQNAFVAFIKLLPGNGVVVTHMDDRDCARIVNDADKEVLDADKLPLPELSIPGGHMRKNAQLVLGLADSIGIPRNQALEALKTYNGCWRRMEVKETFGEGITVVDDYAHHPKEIEATIDAAKEKYPKRRLVVAFQPHMHDRTLKLYDDFLSCFRGADWLVLTDVYDARSDVETQEVDMLKFVEDVRKGSGVETVYGSDLRRTESLLKDTILQPNDVLLVMGAGDITKLADSLIR